MGAGIQVQDSRKIREMVIRAEGLEISYPGRSVLKGIDLEVKRGEFIGVLGSTGSGKSTLAQALNGIIPNLISAEMKGSVKSFGKDTRKTSVAEFSKKIGFVFQDPDAQIFALKVRDEVEFGIDNLRLGRKEERVKKALERAGLIDYLEADPTTLSQGQKQKLAIASVLALEPEALILDEPVSSLDHKSAGEIYRILHELNRKGTTIMVIEHDTEWIAKYATRAIVIEDGRIVLDGKPEKVLLDKRYAALGLKVPYLLKVAKRLGMSPREAIEKLI